MNENEFQEKVIKVLKEQFNNIYLLNTSMRYSIGVPDLIIGLEGKLITIELKVCRKEHASIQYLFPRARKQIATMFDIEKSNSKAYGIILFDIQQNVMLFRIDFESLPITDYNSFKFINNLNLRSVIENPIKYYNKVFTEIHIDDYRNLPLLLRKIK